MRVALVLLLFALAPAAGQELADVRTWVEPDEYFLPMSVHPDEIPHAKLHVLGEIQCQAGMEGPASVNLTYAGSTIKATVEGEEIIYTQLLLQDIVLDWTHVGNDKYVIDAVLDVPIVREGIPQVDTRSSHRWDDVFVTQQGTLYCDPQGYGWDVDEQTFNLTVEGFGEIDDDFEFPESKGTPAPLGLMAIALIGLAMKNRK